MTKVNRKSKERYYRNIHNNSIVRCTTDSTNVYFKGRYVHNKNSALVDGVEKMFVSRIFVLTNFNE